MFENHSCSDCKVSNWCSNVCLPSRGDTNCKIAIYFSYPDAIEDRRGRGICGQRAEFCEWLLKKMGVGMDQVYFDYIVKCAPGKLFPKNKAERMDIVRPCRQYLIATMQVMKQLKSVVALGGLPCEVLTGHAQLGNYVGTKQPVYEPSLRGKVPHIWVAYDPLFAIEKPVESGAIYRTIFMAAGEAGLKPHAVQGVPAFDFGK